MYFLVSFVFMVTGISLVITFINLYLVPKMQHPSETNTMCTILGFYSSDGANICQAPSHNGTFEYHCVNVKVAYNTGPHSHEIGRLSSSKAGIHLGYADGSNGRDIQRNSQERNTAGIDINEHVSTIYLRWKCLYG